MVTEYYYDCVPSCLVIITTIISYELTQNIKCVMFKKLKVKKTSNFEGQLTSSIKCTIFHNYDNPWHYYQWFHGKMTRQEAERTFSKFNYQEGDYIVREREQSETYALSFMLVLFCFCLILNIWERQESEKYTLSFMVVTLVFIFSFVIVFFFK